MEYTNGQFSFAPSELLQGSVGRYQPIAPLRNAAGGTSRVFTALDEEGELRALKISTGGLDDDTAHEIAQERRLATQHGEAFGALTLGILDHGRARCRSAHGELDVPWLIRPLARGSLEDWLDTPRPLVARVAMAARALSLVSRLHGLDVAHRDLKPRNLVWLERLDRGVEVYLIDFGTVRELKPGQSGTLSVRGTPGYQPVEAFLGASGRAHDVFSLGVTVYRLVVGSEPGAGARHQAESAALLPRLGARALPPDPRRGDTIRSLLTEAQAAADGDPLRAPLSADEEQRLRVSLAGARGATEPLLRALRGAMSLLPARRSLPALVEATREVAAELGATVEADHVAAREERAALARQQARERELDVEERRLDEALARLVNA